MGKKNPKTRTRTNPRTRNFLARWWAGFWAWLFRKSPSGRGLAFGGSGPDGEIEDGGIPETPDSLPRELEKARKKFQNFHLTRSMKAGEEIVRKDYKLKKTSTHLYRLEGRDFNLVLVTGNSLSERDGKVQGVLQISEQEVNRALQREHSSLGSFLDLWNPVFTGDLPNQGESKDWRRILGWEVFWKEQILLRLRADTVAVLLVALDADFERFFMNTATTKQKKIVQDEVFYLNRGKNSSEWNPHTKNKTLLEPDSAIAELNRVVEELQAKREREQGTR